MDEAKRLEYITRIIVEKEEDKYKCTVEATIKHDEDTVDIFKSEGLSETPEKALGLAFTILVNKIYGKERKLM